MLMPVFGSTGVMPTYRAPLTCGAALSMSSLQAGVALMLVAVDLGHQRGELRGDGLRIGEHGSLPTGDAHPGGRLNGRGTVKLVASRVLGVERRERVRWCDCRGQEDLTLLWRRSARMVPRASGSVSRRRATSVRWIWWVRA